MAIALGSGYFVVKAKDEATGQVERMSADMRARLGGIAQTASFAMAAAGSAVLGFIGASVKAFADAERSGAQLEAVIKSTGGAAGMTAEAVNKYAESVQAAGKAEGDAVVSASALMLTFTNVGRDVFPQAMDAVIDMSVAMGQDLQGSVIQVGKALNDPINGITALTRVGVTFTEEQKAVIESLVSTGNVAEAQRMIIAELAREFGGSAAAQAQTFSGQLEKLKWELGDVMENIGQAAIPALKQLGEQLKEILLPMAEWIRTNPEATAEIVKWAGVISVAAMALIPLNAAIQMVVALWPLVAAAIGAEAAAIGAPVAVVIAAVAAIGIAAYEVITNWEQVKGFFSDLWDSIVAVFNSGVEWVGEAAGWFAGNVVQAFTDPIAFITEYWQSLVDFFSWVWDGIQAGFDWAVENVFGPMGSYIKEFWNSLTSGFSEGFGEGFTEAAGGFATGGRVGRSGFYNVGELGPERLWLPRGAEVTSASATRAMEGAGGAVSVNVSFGDVRIGSEQDMDTLVVKMTHALERTLVRRGLALRGV